MLNIVVQAHPARTAAVSELTAALAHHDAAARVEWDDGRGPAQTWLACLREPPPAGEFLTYLQDDCWLAPGFGLRLRGLLARGPFAVLMLYTGRKEAAANPRGYAMLSPTAMWSAVGLSIAAGIIPAFAEFYPRWLADHPRHTFANDLAMAAFCRRERLPVACACPPLVQHRPNRSLLGHGSGRESKHFKAAYGEVPPC